MEVEEKYGPVILCDKCGQACGINSYGDWFEGIIDNDEEYEHLCPNCYNKKN